MPNVRDAVPILEDFFMSNKDGSSSLDLSSCDLSMLPPLFESLVDAHPNAASRVTLLNLAHNSLSTLPLFLKRLPNLRILFLLGNAFESVPDVISRLPSLTMLSFKQCALKGTLHASSLPSTLTWLILTSNRLTGLSDDFAKRCSRIRKLMLSNNQLKRLPEGLSVHMQDLELVRLSNNEISEIPMDLLTLRALKWLALSGNGETGGRATMETLPKKLDVGVIEVRYDVDWDHPLGSGTSGTAFAAVDKISGADVVIKRFRNEEGSDGRALDEIQVACASQGVAGLVQAVGYGLDGCGVMGLVLERIAGHARALARAPSLESCTRSVYGDERLRLSRGEKYMITDCVRNSVEALHQRGICHGDVYAHNVLVSWKDGAVSDVRLGDVGAAWFVPERIRGAVYGIEQRAVEVVKNEVFGLGEA